MGKGINELHEVWKSMVIGERNQTDLPSINFNQIVSAVFATGPFYYYIIDFYDFSISNISDGFKDAHGIDPENIRNINDILSLIHPDDINFVTKAEDLAFKYINEQIGLDKIKLYKFSYNFRFLNSFGSYDFYNHQSLILTTDEKKNFVKSINIHTNISHLTKTNSYTLSIIGLNGLPSFLNIPISEFQETEIALNNNFSKREIEVLKMIADGINSREIADRLFISLETVKSHRKNIFKKSGCNSAAELVARSVSEGWI